jgi:hypothetical protein
VVLVSRYRATHPGEQFHEPTVASTTAQVEEARLLEEDVHPTLIHGEPVEAFMPVVLLLPSRAASHLGDRSAGQIRYGVAQSCLQARCRLCDVPGCVALAGVDEARRRLDAAPGVGLVSAVKYAQSLARSVESLCSHLESLRGITFCASCDQPINAGDQSRSYDKFSSSGGGATAHFHTVCPPTSRRR